MQTSSQVDDLNILNIIQQQSSFQGGAIKSIVKAIYEHFIIIEKKIELYNQERISHLTSIETSLRKDISSIRNEYIDCNRLVNSEIDNLKTVSKQNEINIAFLKLGLQKSLESHSSLATRKEQKDVTLLEQIKLKLIEDSRRDRSMIMQYISKEGDEKLQQFHKELDDMCALKEEDEKDLLPTTTLSKDLIKDLNECVTLCIGKNPRIMDEIMLQQLTNSWITACSKSCTVKSLESQSHTTAIKCLEAKITVVEEAIGLQFALSNQEKLIIIENINRKADYQKMNKLENQLKSLDLKIDHILKNFSSFTNDNKFPLCYYFDQLTRDLNRIFSIQENKEERKKRSTEFFKVAKEDIPRMKECFQKLLKNLEVLLQTKDHKKKSFLLPLIENIEKLIKNCLEEDPDLDILAKQLYHINHLVDKYKAEIFEETLATTKNNQVFLTMEHLNANLIASNSAKITSLAIKNLEEKTSWIEVFLKDIMNAFTTAESHREQLQFTVELLTKELSKNKDLKLLASTIKKRLEHEFQLNKMQADKVNLEQKITQMNQQFDVLKRESVPKEYAKMIEKKIFKKADTKYVMQMLAHNNEVKQDDRIMSFVENDSSRICEEDIRKESHLNHSNSTTTLSFLTQPNSHTDSAISLPSIDSKFLDSSKEIIYEENINNMAAVGMSTVIQERIFSKPFSSKSKKERKVPSIN